MSHGSVGGIGAFCKRCRSTLGWDGVTDCMFGDKAATCELVYLCSMYALMRYCSQCVASSGVMGGCCLFVRVRTATS